MKSVRKAVAACAALALLAACSNQAATALHDAQVNCNAGNPFACNSIPQLTQAAADEQANNNTSALAVAGGILGAASLGVSAYQAANPAPVYNYTRVYRYR
jgi:hypothetical protein